jgi:hypothetical protein
MVTGGSNTGGATVGATVEATDVPVKVNGAAFASRFEIIGAAVDTGASCPYLASTIA